MRFKQNKGKEMANDLWALTDPTRFMGSHLKKDKERNGAA
jgi:hypothetical protein